MAKYSYNLSISEEESGIISVIRVLAMFAIVICHLLPVTSPFRQILVLGVCIFFIISGFIYGQKDIKDTRKWLKNRFVRILVPVYSFYVIVFVILLLLGRLGELDFVAVLMQLLNLQGFVDRAGIGNVYTGHLWYISFILVCYVLTPVLQNLRGRISHKTVCLLLLAASVTEGLVICNVKSIQSFTVWIPGIFTYVSAYFVGAYWNKTIRKKDYILFSVLTASCVAARICMKKIADIDLRYEVFYTRVMVQYTQMVLAYWICVTVFLICRKYMRIVKQTGGFVTFFDNISYEVYVVHQALCAGALSVMSLANSIIVNLVIFSIITLFVAIALNRISASIFMLIKK